MALATSKRKFYKLLDNLSSSKTSLSPADAQKDPTKNPSSQSPTTTPNKRSRMVDSTRPSFTSAARSKTTTVRILSSNFEVRPSSARHDSGRAAASYAPWSHEAFLARLKTFSDVKVWGPKPDCINEVAWARRGWVVSGRNEVGCGGCGERVLVRLDNGDFDGGDSRPREGGDCEDRWWGEEAEERLIEKYESLIVEGHDKECLWRKSGSKDDIYRITFSDQDAWQPGLVQRYSSLITLSDILPEEVTTPTVIEDKDRDAFDLEKLTTWFTSIWKQYLDSQQSSQAKENISSTLTTQTPKTVPTTKINKVVLTMALCGWEGQDVSDVKIAYCPKCFARVGLWMYKASSLNEDGLILDPVTLHRQHCPWQNSLSQSGLGRFAGLAGWEILNEIICSNINRAQRQRGLSRVGDDEDESVYGDGPRPSREEVEDEDRVRESKLKRLRRALSVRKMARTPDGSSR